MNWYALFVETGKEDLTRKWLKFYFHDSELHVFIPRRKVPEKRNGTITHITKLLFPGYVLVYTDLNIRIRNIINSIPTVIRIIGNGNEYSSINENEISYLLKLTNSSEIIDYSQVYYQDKKVKILSGPLCGMEGIVKKIDKHKKRAKVIIRFMESEKYVDLGIEILSLS